MVLGDAGLDRHLLAGRALGGLFDLAGIQRLQRDLSLDQLLLEHLVQRAQPVLGRGVEHELVLPELDRRLGVLEVEPGRRLAVGLVDRVADLLQVDLGHDVEAGHGSTIPIVDRRAASQARSRRPRRIGYPPPHGSVSEWPKEAGCKPAGIAYGGSNPPRPTSSSLSSPRPRVTMPLRSGGDDFPPPRPDAGLAPFPQGDIEVAVADTLSSPDADRSADGRLTRLGRQLGDRVETLADHTAMRLDVTKVRRPAVLSAQRADAAGRRRRRRLVVPPAPGPARAPRPHRGGRRRVACRARRSSSRWPGPGSSGEPTRRARRRPASCSSAWSRSTAASSSSCGSGTG